ncbi:hypothetical protein N7365_11365 [Pseudomonas sediminis]|uniref:hypothetical protein n=1 Tax=Pseudomonas sediminis TaxID=1691904 RepID=UPI002448A9CD|nr:hypothetical protein [Pseudomonas sediminis]MDG9758697.1 hypothetical protein [Pseudomonas sediminis]
MTVTHNTEWVTVPQGDINKPERVYRDGAGFQFMLAPSDVPVAFRILMEPESSPKTMIIEFKYLSAPEDTTLVSHKDGISAEVGKLSMKLYRLYVDLAAVAAHVANSLNAKIDFAIPVMSDSVERFGHDGQLRSGNADAVKRLINIKSNFLHTVCG